MGWKSSSSEPQETPPVRRWSRLPTVGVAVAASLALHALWVLSMPRSERRSLQPSAAVEFSFVEDAAKATPAPTPVAPETASGERPTSERAQALPSPTPNRPAPAARRAKAAAPLEPPAAEAARAPEKEASAAERADAWGPGQAEPEPPAGPAEAEKAAAPAASGSGAEAAALALALSPRRAAASLLPPDAPPGSVCLPRTATTAGTCELDDRGLQARAEARLQRSLEESARSVPHLAKREPPELHRQGDGSYRYDGHVFVARVGLDGQVEFADRAGSLKVSPTGIGASFDLTDAVEHGVLGKERYSAEKAWFLEQTAPLRGVLAERARAAERMAARRALERELERILADGALAPPQKRARVFALWQDCGDDQEARETQLLVEAFVRSRLPRGSEMGFSEDELRRLNSTRNGMRAFAPYREAPAGAPG